VASAIETAFGATNERWSAATSSSQIARTDSDVISRSSTSIGEGYGAPENGTTKEPPGTCPTTLPSQD
jgi:hypothetical protein